jgi:hypothetical protein
MVYQDQLSKIIDEFCCAPGSAHRLDGECPRDGIAALTAGGLLALSVPEELGGFGFGPDRIP